MAGAEGPRCVGCWAPITGRRRDARYCAPGCRIRAWRARKRRVAPGGGPPHSRYKSNSESGWRGGGSASGTRRTLVLPAGQGKMNFDGSSRQSAGTLLPVTVKSSQVTNSR